MGEERCADASLMLFDAIIEGNIRPLCYLLSQYARVWHGDKGSVRTENTTGKFTQNGETTSKKVRRRRQMSVFVVFLWLEWGDLPSVI